MIAYDLPEGATPIDADEAAALIPSLSTLEELNDFEALNIAQAINWASRSRQIKRELLSPETLKLLHQKMFNRTWKWAGRFRMTEKSIGVSPYRISTELRGLIDDVKCWQEFSTYPVNEIGVRFHHRLVWIHPFANGNGRHARLATDLLLEQLGSSPFTWGSKDLTSQGGVRRRYLESLWAADRHDMQPLLRFVRS